MQQAMQQQCRSYTTMFGRSVFWLIWCRHESRLDTKHGPSKHHHLCQATFTRQRPGSVRYTGLVPRRTIALLRSASITRGKYHHSLPGSVLVDNLHLANFTLVSAQ